MAVGLHAQTVAVGLTQFESFWFDWAGTLDSAGNLGNPPARSEGTSGQV